MGYLLGIDAGTTTVKASLFDADKGALASSSVECSCAFTHDNVAEIDMDRYWSACKECIEKIARLSNVDLKKVKALAISSQGVTFVPVDNRGKPLRNGILTYDNRAQEEAEQLLRRFGEDRIYEITGQPFISSMFEAPKIMWLRAHDPDCFDAIHKLLLVHDYIAFKMSGNYVCVEPVISSSLLFDLKRRKWWDEMLEAIGLPEEKLPAIHKPGDQIGNVTGNASLETGLSEKTSVIAGAIDQVCGMLGIGNIRPGSISESTGSVLAVHSVSNDMFPRKESGIHNFCNALNDTYALISVCPTAGAALNWFKDSFCQAERRKALESGNDVFDLLVHQAEKVAPGSEGLVMLAHLAGRGSPEPNPLAKGIFYGFRLHHTKAHFVRSVLESVAYMLKSNIDVFGASGLKTEEIRSFGGGSKSRVWNQIKADVCALPVITSRFREPGCLGAAILAGVGCGEYESVEDGCERLVSLEEPLVPNAKNSDRYQSLYKEYQKLDRFMDQIYEEGV
jgi:xylulokinase